MKTFLTILITFIMTIVLEVALLVGFVWFKNPFGIKAFVFPDSIELVDGEKAVIDTSTLKPGEIRISPQQEAVLETLGVDTANLPTTIPKTLEDCFVAKLGQKRADEIRAGAVPSPFDILKAKSCIE